MNVVRLRRCRRRPNIYSVSKSPGSGDRNGPAIATKFELFLCYASIVYSKLFVFQNPQFCPTVHHDICFQTERYIEHKLPRIVQQSSCECLHYAVHIPYVRLNGKHPHSCGFCAFANALVHSGFGEDVESLSDV